MAELLKITPGPWIVNSSAVKANWPTAPITICEANLLSFIDGKKAPREQQINNLFAIAAVPDMYAALQLCREVIEYGGIFSTEERKAVEAAHAAMKKAVYSG